AHAAAQREPEDPAVQQPDLRADQGPVQPDVRRGQGHQVDPDGLAGPPVQPGVAGAGRGGDVRGAGAGLGPGAADRGAAGRGLAPTVTGVFRNVSRPTYDDLARDQVRQAAEAKPADLQALLHGKDTWTVA